jgi:hypothetical protein
MKYYLLSLAFIFILLSGFGCQNDNQANIVVTSPISGMTVANPIQVTGQGRVFENVVSWRIKNNDGLEIATGTAEAAASDMGQFGPIDFGIVVPEVQDPNIILEVFWASPKDGSDLDLVSIPLTLERIDTTNFQLYFHNDTLDPDVSCVKVFPVTRTVVATEAPARAALILLLQGPTAGEQSDGYSSIIPFHTWLKGLSFTANGLATADFGGAIAGPIGGSCYVGGIAQEIEQTLKQFDTIEEVKILIDGRPDKLQP